MQNNLFNYATSELSQDAFISWLASFALEGSPDPVLRECAIQLLIMFVPELKTDTFSLESIENQVKLSEKNRLDVLLTIRCNNKILKVIVEDKTHTSEGDNQLARYTTQARENYPGCDIRGVYYKTGFQSDLSPAIKAGYTIITRAQMLSFMKPFVSRVSNRIFLDYYEYWNAFQKETEKYSELPTSKWNWKQINGFYDHLKTSKFFEKQGMRMGYGYVNNQTGGFEGLWAYFDDCSFKFNDTTFELYLQMEIKDHTFAQLCLKLGAKQDNVPAEVLRACKNQLSYDTDWNYKLNQYNFKKPKRLATGRHMTIGIYDADLKDHSTIKDILESAIQDYSQIINALR